MNDTEQKIIAIAAQEAPQNKNSDQVLNAARLILRECANFGITSRNQLAYVLATAHHESCLGAWMREFADGSAYEGRRDLGNTQAGDGPRYKGRGFVQLTGRNNYTKYAQILGIDLVGNPELAADPQYAAKILAHGMSSGAYTGKKLASYERPDGSYDFVGARYIVNGQDKADKIAAQAQKYLAALGVASNSPTVTTAAQPGAITPVSYKVVVPQAKATVRSGAGRSFAIITTLNADPNRQYTADGEAQGELVGNDNVWVRIPEVGGFVTRTALRIVG